MPPLTWFLQKRLFTNPEKVAIIIEQLEELHLVRACSAIG